MTKEPENSQEPGPATDLPSAPAWEPQRGDLAYDTATGRTGVVIAIPEDTGADLHHLRQEVGGDDWTARHSDLRPAHTPPAGPEPPGVGSILSTIYGRQRVMDVLELPHDEPTVYLRPERGRLEWTVPLAHLTRVIQP